MIMINVKETTKRYIGIGLMLIIFLWMVGITAGCFRPDWMLMAPVWVATAFSVVVLVAFGLLWQWVSKKHPDSITTLYYSVSGFRMLLALFTLLICYLIVGRDNMLSFVLVFMIFYFVMVGYHTIFFSRLLKRQ